MYNIGGKGAPHSVLWLRISSYGSSKWRSMDLAEHNFKGYYYREAFAVENEIVYFGSLNVKGTYVLAKEEESEQLRVVRED